MCTIIWILSDTENLDFGFKAELQPLDLKTTALAKNGEWDVHTVTGDFPAVLIALSLLLVCIVLSGRLNSVVWKVALHLNTAALLPRRV